MFLAVPRIFMSLRELFCGFLRVPGAAPIACLPQAWA